MYMQVGGTQSQVISFQPYGLAPATFNIFWGTELTGLNMPPGATLGQNQQFTFQPRNSAQLGNNFNKNNEEIPLQPHSSEEF